MILTRKKVLWFLLLLLPAIPVTAHAGLLSQIADLLR